jgi:hypothetical protein
MEKRGEKTNQWDGIPNVHIAQTVARSLLSWVGIIDGLFSAAVVMIITSRIFLVDAEVYKVV